MGIFQELSISGITYTTPSIAETNAGQDNISKPYNHTTQPIISSTAKWRIKNEKPLLRNKGLDYLDENGNPIEEEVVKILLNNGTF